MLGNVSKPQTFCIVHPGSDVSGAKFRFCESSIEIEAPHSSHPSGVARCEEFSFDRVFAPKTAQEKVFQDVAKQPVLDTLERFQSTAFIAFGSTGGGKTFTVTGGAKRFADRGLIPRSISALFEALSARSDREEYQVTVTFFEIYKDSVVDLLSDRRRRITVQSEGAGITLLGLVKHTAATESDAYHLLFQGDSNRHFERFPLNSETSRGHVFYILNVTHLPSGREASLSFIDLAAGISMKNNATTSIERGLKVLKAVSSAMRTGRMPPYDDSLLTQILRPVLETSPTGERVHLVAIAPIKYMEQTRKDVFDWLQFTHIFHEAMVSHGSSGGPIASPRRALDTAPTIALSAAPSVVPSVLPIAAPSMVPSMAPTVAPSVAPSALSARAALGMNNFHGVARNVREETRGFSIANDGSGHALLGEFGGNHIGDGVAYPQGIEGAVCGSQATDDLSFRSVTSPTVCSPRPAAHLAAETEMLSSFDRPAPLAMAVSATNSVPPVAIAVPVATQVNASVSPTVAPVQARSVRPAPGTQPPGVMKMVASAGALLGTNLCKSGSSMTMVSEPTQAPPSLRTASPQPSRVNVPSCDGRPMTPVDGRRLSPQDAAGFSPGSSSTCRSRPPMSPAPSTQSTPILHVAQCRTNIYAASTSVPFTGGGPPRSPLPASASPQQQQQQQTSNCDGQLARAPSPMYGGGIAKGGPPSRPLAPIGTGALGGQLVFSMQHGIGGHHIAGTGGGTSSRAASPLPQRGLQGMQPGGSFVASPTFGSASRSASVTRTPPPPRTPSPHPGSATTFPNPLLPGSDWSMCQQGFGQQGLSPHGFKPQVPPPQRAVSPMRTLSPHPQVRHGSVPNLAWAQGAVPPQGASTKGIMPQPGLLPHGSPSMRCASPLRMQPISAHSWQYGGS